MSDLTFSRFTFHNRTPNRKEVVKINKLIIRSAESIVFYRDNHNWVHRFVAENSAFRIETHPTRINTNGDILPFITQRIVEIEKISNN